MRDISIQIGSSVWGDNGAEYGWNDWVIGKDALGITVRLRIIP